MKSLIVVFASSDQDSLDLVDYISSTPELNSMVKYLDIEYDIIDRIIRNASNIKVKAIPSLIAISNNDIQVFETEKCFEFIEQVIENIEKHREPKMITSLNNLWNNNDNIQLQQPQQPQQLQQLQQPHVESNIGVKKKPKIKSVSELAEERSEIKITSPPVERGGGP